MENQGRKGERRDRADKKTGEGRGWTTSGPGVAALFLRAGAPDTHTRKEGGKRKEGGREGGGKRLLIDAK